jgi:hypothetical protein
MSKVKELHNQAMQWAEKALVARRQNDKLHSIDYSKQAFLLEAEAAALIPNEEASEPTRSILYCSAASLAFEAKCFKEAGRLAIQGLAGFPSKRIEKELNTLYEKVSFESHLSLNEIEIADEDFQLTLQGHAVSNGFIFYDLFKEKFEALQKLLEKTTQRLMNVPYKTGNIAKDLKPFVTGISVARAGSYAITVRLAHKENQQTQLLIKPEEVINENNEENLKEHIHDIAYYNHFLSMASKLAPDGYEITGIGLTGKKSKTGLTRKNSDIKLFSTEIVIEKNSDIKEIKNIVGILDLASAKPNKPEYLELTAENKDIYRLRASEGLDDYVRTFYKQQVIVSGKYDGEYIFVTDLKQLK